MTGKGSSPRPLYVSDEEFGKRFDAIDWAGRNNKGKGCHATLAKGQWWTMCGEINQGDDLGLHPALCTDCGGTLRKAAQ